MGFIGLIRLICSTENKLKCHHSLISANAVKLTSLNPINPFKKTYLIYLQKDFRLFRKRINFAYQKREEESHTSDSCMVQDFCTTEKGKETFSHCFT